MVSDINEMQGNPSKFSPVLSRNKRIIDTNWSSEQIALVFSLRNLGYHNRLQMVYTIISSLALRGKTPISPLNLICL